MQVISAPSILGLKPTGVELLADRILKDGLPLSADETNKIISITDLNHLYSGERDPATGCLNAIAIRDHAILICNEVTNAVTRKEFALVLGGDCSILIGAMTALKGLGKTGLIFFDAHADFYSPEKSVTGEVADMDLAIVSGRGPRLLTGIFNRSPYVHDADIIHIGQRDEDEVAKYDSADIRLTEINCFSEETIKISGANLIAEQVRQALNKSQADLLWIHFDTDVLNDKINPAVDYRLPGGLQVDEVRTLIQTVLKTKKCAGMTVTIYNPLLDKNGSARVNIMECIREIFV